VNAHLKILLRLSLAAVAFDCQLQTEAQTKPPAATKLFESVFIIPTSPKDGHDPFYPDSIRTLETKSANNNTFEIGSLKFLGLSGTPGNYFAIINNHTFTIGDGGDVVTPSGRVHLRCVGISETAVMVEINGQVYRVPLNSK
jgi:hypothetical protein